jgi:hypothetical protein
MKATPIAAMEVSKSYSFDGVDFLHTSVTADSYDEYKALPAGVTFDGKTYGKAGWNSDTGDVIYRTDRKVALAIS